VSEWSSTGRVWRRPQSHPRSPAWGARAALATRGLAVASLLSLVIITGLSVQGTVTGQPHESTSVVVRINDRGSYVGGRVMDLSRGAAQAVSTTEAGIVPIKLDVLPSL
jgi:Lytic transglycolase